MKKKINEGSERRNVREINVSQEGFVVSRPTPTTAGIQKTPPAKSVAPPPPPPIKRKKGD